MLVELFNKPFKTKPRGYIGASIIGHPCERYIWLNKYGKYHNIVCEIPFQLSRIFERGQLEEPRILKLIRQLKEWKLEAYQKPVRIGFLKGNIDAILKDAEGNRYVLEIKTMGDKSFKKFQTQGVRKSHPQYFWQVQAYMDMADIRHAILLAVNKNTEAMHEELIEFNADVAYHAIERAKRINALKEMPTGLAGAGKKQMECQGCSFEQFCWKEQEHEPLQNAQKMA